MWDLGVRVREGEVTGEHPLKTQFSAGEQVKFGKTPFFVISP